MSMNICAKIQLYACFFFQNIQRNVVLRFINLGLRDAKMVSLWGAPTEWLLINGISSYCPPRLKQVAITQEPAYKYFK